MAQRPGLADFMQLSQGFSTVAEGHRRAEDHQQRKEYRGQQMEMQQRQMDRRAEADARDEAVAEMLPQFSDALTRGEHISRLPELAPEGADPRAIRKAQTEAAGMIMDQHDMNESVMRARAQQYSMDRQALQQTVHKAEMAYQVGDMDRFNELMDTAYNNYIYDGHWVNDRRKTPEGEDAIEVEAVDGQRQQVIDDLPPEQKLQIAHQMSDDPKTYFQNRSAAHKARREFNKEQWINEPVALKGDDGNIFYAVKQVDPDTDRAVTLVFDTYPHPGAEPVRTEPGTKLIDQAGADLAETGDGGADDYTLNQGRSRLKERFFQEGAMGQTISVMNNARERYNVAIDKYNKMVNDGESVLNAEQRAFNYVDQVERDFYEELARHPDKRKQVEKQFESQFGYVPDPSGKPAGIDVQEQSGGGKGTFEKLKDWGASIGGAM